jgi:hypothetical protein
MARPKGIPMSEEAKDLIRQARLGQTKSATTRKRMSNAAKQRSPEHYTNSHAPEARAKAAAKNKGKKPWHAGLPSMPQQLRDSISASKKGKPKSPDHCRKMSEARQGEKSHLWKGGVHNEHNRERQVVMHQLKYRNWRKSVLERANKTCELKDTSCSGPLQAHHIQSWTDFPELRYEVSNGQCLCRDHHQRTDNFAGRALALTKAA